MNSDAGFLRLATKLGIPSFIRTGNSQCGFRAGRIFQVEDQCTGNSQSRQSGAIILRQRVTIQSAQGGRGHSLIKVTEGACDTDVPYLERSQQLKRVVSHFDSPRPNR